MSTHHYFSLQYSAIQKTVLRHDRLWSIAGISNILSRMNEIDMPAIAVKHDGTAIVAGGGKFTARFASKEAAEKAKSECVMLIATTLPMLEFQVSRVHEGESFQSLKDGKERNLLITELGDRKRQFRGYAVSFNPHLQLCGECGEYPVQDLTQRGKKSTPVCRVCKNAFEESRAIHNDQETQTTLQKVYNGYLREVPDAYGKFPAADFNDLFPNADDERKRMAVWFSDLNNMNDKVPVWLNQKEELDVLRTFDLFRDTVVEIIVRALVATFPKPGGKFLPFRLVVAGGDDLCLVMAEKDILAFVKNISTALTNAKDSLPDIHPLSDAWLLQHGNFKGNKPKPFGFGASFVVTGIHTPFSLIHALGEELMSGAKKRTNREGNSVNWRVMAEDRPMDEEPFLFDRPLFIEDHNAGAAGLSFNSYLELRARYIGSRDIKKLSTSHLQQIVAIMLKVKDPQEMERQLKLLDASESDKSFSPLLHEPSLRNPDGTLEPARLATLFELITIAGGENNEN